MASPYCIPCNKTGSIYYRCFNAIVFGNLGYFTRTVGIAIHLTIINTWMWRIFVEMLHTKVTNISMSLKTLSKKTRKIVRGNLCSKYQKYIFHKLVSSCSSALHLFINSSSALFLPFLSYPPLHIKYFIYIIPLQYTNCMQTR